MGRANDYKVGSAPHKEDFAETNLYLQDELDKVSDRMAELIENVEEFKQNSVEIFVAAGYGGMGMNSTQAIGTVLVDVWEKIGGFDLPLIVPRGITYDFLNDGLIFGSEGVWQISFKITTTFTEVNNGRRLQVRFWNFTKGTTSGVVFLSLIHISEPRDVEESRMPSSA